jgi:2-keto-4-pentenoate hydratase
VHLADTLATFGEKLSAGDLVICGSIFPPPMIEPDETEFGYSLAPIGDISVRFTR